MVAAEIVTGVLVLAVYAAARKNTGAVYETYSNTNTWIIGGAAFLSTVCFTAAAAIQSTPWFFVWAATSAVYAVALPDNKSLAPIQNRIAYMGLVSSVAAVVSAATSFGMESVTSAEFCLAMVAATFSVMTDAVATALCLTYHDNSWLHGASVFTSLSFPAIAAALIVPHTSASVFLTIVSAVHVTVTITIKGNAEDTKVSQTISVVLYLIGTIMTIVLWFETHSVGVREAAVAVVYFANSFFALSEFIR